MSDDERKYIFEAPYSTAGRSTVSAELRIAVALEYIAYQMGEIRRTLQEINERQKAP